MDSLDRRSSREEDSSFPVASTLLDAASADSLSVLSRALGSGCMWQDKLIDATTASVQRPESLWCKA